MNSLNAKVDNEKLTLTRKNFCCSLVIFYTSDERWQLRSPSKNHLLRKSTLRSSKQLTRGLEGIELKLRLQAVWDCQLNPIHHPERLTEDHCCTWGVVFPTRRKRICVVLYNEVEEGLLIWFKSLTEKNVPVSEPILQTKAEEIARELGVSDFSCSSGWIHCFKTWHNIVLKKVCVHLGSS